MGASALKARAHPKRDEKDAAEEAVKASVRD
jgi:hypothetical protein